MHLGDVLHAMAGFLHQLDGAVGCQVVGHMLLWLFLDEINI